MPSIEVNMEDEDQTSESQSQRTEQRTTRNVPATKEEKSIMDKGTTMLLNFLSLDSAKSPLVLLL